MYIQHVGDMISVYKHNERLLKSAGDKVSAGSPVAVIGNTGELTTGTHLHFELWHKGDTVDPARFINF
jgi:murein DD-endopeptidase MepM/ murein hydrolase activator NlpD